MVAIIVLVTLAFNNCDNRAFKFDAIEKSPNLEVETDPDSVKMVNGSINGVGDLLIWDAQEGQDFLGGQKSIPFSLTYGGKSFDPFSKEQAWTSIRHSETSISYIDPTGILEVRIDFDNYAEFDAVQWHLTLINKSKDRISDVISDLRPGNVQLISSRGRSDRFVLHYSVGALGEDPLHDGSSARPLAMPDFTPIQNAPPTGSVVILQSMNGRSSSGTMPYFNIEKPGGKAGVILAMGWSGQWQSQFAVDSTGTNLRYTGGQQNFRAQLRPGESVRTPATLLMKWSGEDWISGQNRFRQLMLSHFSPRDPKGQVPQPIAAASYANGAGQTHNSEKLLKAIQDVASAHFGFNTFWMDAGWYSVLRAEQDPVLYNSLIPNSETDNLWLTGAGDWQVDPFRFPNGYGEVSDRARAVGLRSLLWFEPERMSLPAKNFSIYAGQSRLLASHFESENERKIFGTVNFSDGENVAMITDLIDARLKSMKIDIFRQDMNGPGPLSDWLLNDQNQSTAMGGIARLGMTEAGYIAGLYRFWDELRRRNPNLLIDNCASGGRRLDFEALSRTVPLWRSDRAWDPIEQQNQMLGVSLWLPLQGRGSNSDTNSVEELLYKIRSGYGWNGTFAFPWGEEMAPAIRNQVGQEVRNLFSQQRNGMAPLSEIFKGDYYPMDFSQVTPPIGDWAGSMPSYVGNDQWVSWQFFRRDLQQGLIQGFRRSTRAPLQTVVRIAGLQPESQYAITDMDRGTTATKLGREWTTTGVVLACETPQKLFCQSLLRISKTDP